MHHSITLDQVVIHTNINFFESAVRFEMFQVHMAFPKGFVEANVRVQNLDPKLPAFGCTK